MRSKQKWLWFAFLLMTSGCEIVPKPAPKGPPPIPEVSNVLLELINRQDQFEIKSQDYESTSLSQIITLGTPAGIRLKLRYSQLGISLVEALKMSRNNLLLERLFELAKWSNRNKVRAEALVTVGTFSDPKDVDYFTTALAENNDIGIRCAAIEAVELWGREGATALLKQAMDDTWSPLAQLLAARALLVLGDNRGLPLLYQYLENRSWIIRAMAARYLGDFAKPEDYTILLTALNKETDNDFVIAETAIAALKLLSKTSKKITAIPAAKGWRDEANVNYAYGQDDVVNVEPLLIQPPRMLISDSTQIAQSINQKLLELIKTRLDVPLRKSDASDPNFENLNRLVTPMGFALQTRYSNLSIAVAEGLGGTNDAFLRAELGKLSEESSNPLTRATALLSLAYNGNPEDLTFITQGLSSDDPVVRFGAMEAVQAGRFKNALPDIASIAANDPIPAFKAFAVQILFSAGDASARTLLLGSLNETDWPARAMAYWYLGRYGSGDDFQTVLVGIGNEDNPFVKTELALAAQRLAP